MAKYFDEVTPQVNFSELEDKINKFWKENKIFEKSVENRPETKKWNFLDGPPFITGLPHYGSLLSSIPKDLFPRYWTMKGYKVRRVWGWDCHGLPAENKVEKKLGIVRKRDIEEKIGVKKFIDECKLYVSEVSSEWEWYVDHIGRWVDFKNAYKTMDTRYMESVMWVFSEMYKKGFIYKGLRVSLYCPHCGTPISNFEVAMDADNYKDVTEVSNTYKYKLKGEKNTYFLAWSTTPWNKLATPALAVNPKLDYVKVSQGTENYILAKSTLKILKDEKYKIKETYKGKDLVGLEFEPHYDFYKIDPGKRAFIVIGGDFVTADEGTGIVTIAAYGEEDLAVMQKENIQIVQHVSDEGIVTKDSPIGGGEYYLKVNKLVNDDLKERGLVYSEEQLTHSVAHCWRCGTRLFYSPQDAWYVDVQSLKPLMKKTNESVNWFPKHFKMGRFLKSLEAAPDWCISRSRYWGSPVPVWECTSCGENFVPGSIKELEEASGAKITDLHKPEIDEVIVKCKKCGSEAKRVSEVLDSWIEAGSASYAERHFPFEEGLKLDDFFPPDFIVEYTGQIRAWFYVLHVIGAALYETNAFKNVVVTGVILGTDGRKMSKNFGNYPDPKEMITKYGGDGLRLYLMGSPVMRGEDILISEEQYRSKVRGTLLILWNVYNFFVQNANLDGWEPSTVESITLKVENVLDRWILNLLSKTLKAVTESLENYDSVGAVAAVEEFISHLSLWYIRRSRDRVGPAADDKDDKDAFYQTSYFVLTTLCQIAAPLVPFTVEEIYRNLTKDESVHLSDWPTLNLEPDEKLLEEMDYGRLVVEKAHAERKVAVIPVRQPLSEVLITSPHSELSGDILKVIAEETNLKKVSWKKGKTLSVKLDIKITPELEEEAKTRELIRNIQGERKNLNIELDKYVEVASPWFPEKKENLERLMKKTLTKTTSIGEFRVTKI